MEQTNSNSPQMNEDVQKAIEQAAKVISEANAILLTSGAGLGVDSGLPDFRGPEGFWRAYPPMQKLGLRFEEMSNPVWFDKQPEFAWGFFGHRYQLYTAAVPHEGYHIMKKWATKMKEGYFVFTSNVDGQWIKEGIPDDHLEECHGAIRLMQCCKNCTKDIWSSSESTLPTLKVDMESFLAKPPLPSCKHCGQLARPNILMFGDWKWNSDYNDVQSDNFSKFKAKLRSVKESGNLRFVVVEVGAGKAVPTVRYTSEQNAEAFGGTLIRINPRDGDFPSSVKGITIPLGGKKGIEEIDKLISWN